MIFNRYAEPVQFILPSVLDHACLPVGKDDGFADQPGSRFTVLSQYSLKIFDASPMALLVPARPSRLRCPKAAQRRCPSAQHWE